MPFDFEQQKTFGSIFEMFEKNTLQTFFRIWVGAVEKRLEVVQS